MGKTQRTRKKEQSRGSASLQRRQFPARTAATVCVLFPSEQWQSPAETAMPGGMVGGGVHRPAQSSCRSWSSTVDIWGMEDVRQPMECPGTLGWSGICRALGSLYYWVSHKRPAESSPNTESFQITSSVDWIHWHHRGGGHWPLKLFTRPV